MPVTPSVVPYAFTPEGVGLARAHRAELQEEIVGLNRKVAGLEKTREAAQEVLSWLDSPSILNSNDCSRAHLFYEALGAGMVVDIHSGETVMEMDRKPETHHFVVTHDWAGALGPSLKDGAVDFRLPYSVCCFEFRISGLAVLAFIKERPEGGADEILMAARASNGLWFVNSFPVTLQGSAPLVFAMGQVAAICIALDAEVATHDVTRAPHALNKKRERNGKPPLNDYHVVSLAKRYRAASGAPHADNGRHVRLHWRRGHWRHFENSKTWIKWMLVGDPALGFIAKHYTL